MRLSFFGFWLVFGWGRGCLLAASPCFLLCSALIWSPSPSPSPPPIPSSSIWLVLGLVEVGEIYITLVPSWSSSHPSPVTSHCSSPSSPFSPHGSWIFDSACVQNSAESQTYNRRLFTAINTHPAVLLSWSMPSFGRRLDPINHCLSTSPSSFQHSALRNPES